MANISQNYSSITNLPLILPAQAYFIINFLPASPSVNIIWSLPNSRDLSKAGQLLNFFKKYNRLKYRWLTFPQDFLSWNAARTTLEPTILLVAQEYWNLALPTPAAIASNTIKLTLGQIIKPTELKTKLLAAGFTLGPLAERSSWFEQQGGILTIAETSQVWRVVWQNNKIESLLNYNLLTSTYRQSVNELILLPQQLTPQIGINLTHYLNSSTVIIGALPDINLPSGQKIPARPLDPSPLAAVPLLAKQWDKINQYIEQQIALGYRIKIFSGDIALLKQKIISGNGNIEWWDVSNNITALNQGFQDDLSQTIYLTDNELMGRHRPYFVTNLSSYDKLKKGDYVVHIDHGIGRFAELTSQLVDDKPHDYLLVEYADDDKLFVPVEHTDRLSRYLGRLHPPLQRLHSASWFRITKKVKTAAVILAHQLLQLYARRQTSVVAPMQSFGEEDLLAASFPWPLTSDQLKAWGEIATDLTRPQPMDRLICGDIGFGKTELAVRAAYRAALNGYQVAVLAPTTLLAQQHYDTFCKRLANLGVIINLLSRAQPSCRRRNITAAFGKKQIDIVIGTQAILSPELKFSNLGLLIIDEEQRFGVKQKELLKQYRPNIHILSLSATPIPRTLNLAMSDLRDLSIIMTPPYGRKKIITTVGQLANSIIKQAIMAEIKRGGQIYYLVNHIADLPAMAQYLKKLIPTLKFNIIHGRLPGPDASRIMHDFDNGKTDLLLATNIIASGLDLPNVNTLIVANAEKFGLADLYQLKGRVGRGTHQAYAYFLISRKLTEASQKRLQALRDAAELGSGLSLALRDMELRGTGAILGQEQHGNITAVGVHLFSQLLTQAVAEASTGQPAADIPEVLLRLPLDSRIDPKLIPDELNRLHVYQRLASLRDPAELKLEAEQLIGRVLDKAEADQQFHNLLTLLEFKLLSERARLREVSCQKQGSVGQFILRFLQPPPINIITHLRQFDPRWHEVESSWQAKHPLAAGAWIDWLKASLNCLI